ncbi:phosphatase PAP2 family protein [Streptomyces sp. NPDC012510]|uniref:phosphatase PAP2 family protein n=1 Tax=Streptomyces sp. NPDC012510 TaxID=3364838 RepID=UPI0036E5FE8B
MECRTEPARERGAAMERPPVVGEFLLVAGLFLVYKFGRRLADGHTTEALGNAHRVWDWERALHLPGEGSVQSALLHGDTLVHLANVSYAPVHFPATAAFLIWLCLRRPAHYVRARRVPRCRWLWLLHPLVPLLVIVGTANHYWLDSVVAGVLLAVAPAVVQHPHRTATTAGRRAEVLVPAEEPVLVGAGR